MRERVKSERECFSFAMAYRVETCLCFAILLIVGEETVRIIRSSKENVICSFYTEI